METTLRNRLTFGPLMLLGLFLLLWLDESCQTWTRDWMQTRYAYARFEGGIGGIGLMIILFAANPIATREIATLFTAERVRPYRFIAGVGNALLITHAFLTQFPPFQPIAASTLAFIVVFIMLFSALRRAYRKETQEAITHMAGTVLSTLYLGGLGWFVMALRVKHGRHHDFHGTTWVVLTMLLMVKFTDIGAYFGGRALGRHKLIPWLSPGKTWEGLFCGLLTAGVVGALCTYHWLGPDRPPIPHVGPLKGFIFGVIIGGIGQVGDLFESMMKRDAEVKDSGRLVPGFGGILDIIDSPLFAAPFAYLLFSFF